MSYDVGLTRKGPGLLVRDLMRGQDAQISAVVARIVDLKPDVLALFGLDFDYDGVAAKLLQDTLEKSGHALPYHFLAAPNTGVPTGFDLDRNGKFGEARDAQGFGRFRGQKGLALFSRYPVVDHVDFGGQLWADQLDTRFPHNYFLPEEAKAVLLHSVAAWDVQLRLPTGSLHVLMSKAGPPVFDGPEDRNGLRNADEIAFWDRYIATLDEPFVILAGLNNDLTKGEGLKPPLLSLLSNKKITDPQPRSDSYGLATVNWDIGRLRVDYVLPSRDLQIRASGVDWMENATDATYGSRHRPVWVDIFWE